MPPSKTTVPAMALASYGFSAALLAVSCVASAASASEVADLSDINSKCIESQLQDCEVLTAGFINYEDSEQKGEPRLAWQTQSGSTSEEGTLGGFVLFEHDDQGWQLLDAHFDGWFSAPTLNETGLLHISGVGSGTGGANADRLYQWRDAEDASGGEGWREIDLHKWWDTIEGLLPTDLEIRKGVAYDFHYPWETPVAFTPLWRPDDAQCCPQGGEAIISFEITDDQLVATKVRPLPSEEEDAP